MEENEYLKVEWLEEKADNVIIGIDNVPVNCLVRNCITGNIGWMMKVDDKNRFILLYSGYAQTEIEQYKTTPFKIIKTVVKLQW